MQRLMTALLSWNRLLPGLADGMLLAVALAVVVLLTAARGPALLGHQSLTVLGGSMEPSIALGSAVVLQAADAQTLAVGDVITFVDRSNALVTHRIIETSADEFGPAFRTQGDANRTPDAELVRPVNVVGRAWYSVPFAGYLVHAVNHPSMKLAAAGMGIAVLVILQLQGLRRPSATLTGSAAQG